MWRAALAFVAKDDSAHGFEGHPHRYMRSQLGFELLRAADLAGRWTVACLLWAVSYWATKQIATNGPVRRETLKDRYIDAALVAGPLVGILWWNADLARREGGAWLARVQRRAAGASSRRLLASPGAVAIGRAAVFCMQLTVCDALGWLLAR